MRLATGPMHYLYNAVLREGQRRRSASCCCKHKAASPLELTLAGVVQRDGDGLFDDDRGADERDPEAEPHDQAAARPHRLPHVPPQQRAAPGRARSVRSLSLCNVSLLAQQRTLSKVLTRRSGGSRGPVLRRRARVSAVVCLSGCCLRRGVVTEGWCRRFLATTRVKEEAMRHCQSQHQVSTAACWRAGRATVHVH